MQFNTCKLFLNKVNKENTEILHKICLTQGHEDLFLKFCQQFCSFSSYI